MWRNDPPHTTLLLLSSSSFSRAVPNESNKRRAIYGIRLNGSNISRGKPFCSISGNCCLQAVSSACMLIVRSGNVLERDRAYTLTCNDASVAASLSFHTHEPLVFRLQNAPQTQAMSSTPRLQSKKARSGVRLPSIIFAFVCACRHPLASL